VVIMQAGSDVMAIPGAATSSAGAGEGASETGAALAATAPDMIAALASAVPAVAAMITGILRQDLTARMCECMATFLGPCRLALA
jgi:hypothetical protein